MYNNKDLTWGDIKIASIRKMFLNNNSIELTDLETMKGDKKYRTYIDAMAGVYNEALSYISNIRPIKKVIVYENNTDIEKEEDLNLLFANFYAKKILNSNKLDIKDNILYIPKNRTIEVEFEIYPKYMHNESDNNEALELPYDVSSIIPLYIAGELYKEDDLTLATMYMNEFMNQLNVVLKNNPVDIEQIEDVYGCF